MSARYLTTTLPYVNADPHIGFALEVVQADVLARIWRARGEDVFFSMGTDEHGQKIYEAAQKAGEGPQVYSDRYAEEFKKLKDALDLSNDAFIRTTSPGHREAAQEMWKRCFENQDIEKRTFTGMYCVGCESFKTEKETADGHCVIHTNLPLQEISEENYFFKFKKYEKRLLDYLSRPDVVIPEWRREEAIAFVQGGLEDFSVSREKARLPWGIPVPGDDTQVMYVWFDALTGYISTLGWPSDAERKFQKFWADGVTLQVAGKDQVRFQSLMWQAMLMSAGIKTTDRVFYHGFINSGRQKMSKSLGNVISPYDLVAKYGTDATRYILLRHVSPVEDSDLTLEAIHDHYTAHLTNGLGNLVARVMQMATTHLQGPVEMTKETQSDVSVTAYIERFEFNRAMDSIWERVGHDDALIAIKRPFAGIKSGEESVRNEALLLIKKLVRELNAIAIDLEPFMPSTSAQIKEAVLTHKKPENLFPRL
ncbi:TPA: methionine--tRNA ligase [Candidatus Kaiserbacteria bacterium]|nr:MAG: Methionine-tRNA ligase [Parcubacteria group bacterium GW2011_GWA1_56_13]KKW47051.1 MAG: Methionine-tRNA ligase [Parcubacteria group bacterium GW2011_GWB1_57_6]HCR52710.1 methionine--tRNA ligase [Candidatus Kaiserbacteria bacterium]